MRLTYFVEAHYRPSKRKTKCKDCLAWDFDLPTTNIIPANKPRIVLVTDGFGGAKRHLTLCPNHASEQAVRLEILAAEIRQAVMRGANKND